MRSETGSGPSEVLRSSLEGLRAPVWTAGLRGMLHGLLWSGDPADLCSGDSWWLGLWFLVGHSGGLIGFTGGAAIGWVICRVVSRDSVARWIDRKPRWSAVRHAFLAEGFWKTFGIVTLIRIPPELSVQSHESRHVRRRSEARTISGRNLRRHDASNRDRLRLSPRPPPLMARRTFRRSCRTRASFRSSSE